MLSIAIVVLVLVSSGCLDSSSDERVYTEANLSTTNAKAGEKVWFNGTSPDRSGTIVCSWESSIDGTLSTNRSFSSKSLSPGTHTIYFECKDEQNSWLERAITHLEIIDDTVLITIDCTEDSNGHYQCRAIKTSKNYNLEAYQYFLKDSTGLTKQFGEIALQNISGDWHGVDVTWDDDGSADTNQGNGKADRADGAGGAYSDTPQAQIRLDAVQAGTQDAADNQKSEGTISVRFNDNDRNGKLTAGDQFTVRGNDATHTANDDYTFVLKYDISDDVVSTVNLGD